MFQLATRSVREGLPLAILWLGVVLQIAWLGTVALFCFRFARWLFVRSAG